MDELKMFLVFKNNIYYENLVNYEWINSKCQIENLPQMSEKYRVYY